MNLNVKCYQNTLKYSKIVKYYYSSKSRVRISNIKHSCDAKVNFLRAQNHSNMMICCSRNIYEYYQLKTVALLHIFVEIYLKYNIFSTVSFDRFNASLNASLKKNI